MNAVAWSVALCALIGQATSTPESTHRIVEEDSLFGLVAYKDGFAAGLVDNNLTNAKAYTVHFVYGSTPDSIQFDLRMDAAQMMVNDYDVQARWFPRLKELGILDTPFKETSGWRQRRMSRAVVSERLLDAEHFPYVEARTVSVTKNDRDPSGQGYLLGLEITIREKTERVEWPAKISHDGDTIVVETHGALKFTSFGIDPYSRFFGAIQYKDEFHIFAHMVAVPIAHHKP